MLEFLILEKTQKGSACIFSTDGRELNMVAGLQEIVPQLSPTSIPYGFLLEAYTTSRPFSDSFSVRLSSVRVRNI